jgi:hypothetical protein
MENPRRACALEQHFLNVPGFQRGPGSVPVRRLASACVTRKIHSKKMPGEGC